MSILNKRVMPQGAVDTTMSFAQPTGSSLTWSTPSSQTAPAGTAYSGTSTATLPSGNYWTNTTGTATVGVANVSATVGVSGSTATVTYTGTQPAADQTGITTSVSGLAYAALSTNYTQGGGDLSSLTVYSGTWAANGFQMGVNGLIQWYSTPVWPGGGWTLQVYTSAGSYINGVYQSPTVTGLNPNPRTGISSSTFPNGLNLNMGLGATSGFTGTANYYWRTYKNGYYTKTVNFMRITFV